MTNASPRFQLSKKPIATVLTTNTQRAIAWYEGPRPEDPGRAVALRRALKNSRLTLMMRKDIFESQLEREGAPSGALGRTEKDFSDRKDQ